MAKYAANVEKIIDLGNICIYFEYFDGSKMNILNKSKIDIFMGYTLNKQMDPGHLKNYTGCIACDARHPDEVLAVSLVRPLDDKTAYLEYLVVDFAHKIKRFYSEHLKKTEECCVNDGFAVIYSRSYDYDEGVNGTPVSEYYEGSGWVNVASISERNSYGFKIHKKVLEMPISSAEDNHIEFLKNMPADFNCGSWW